MMVAIALEDHAYFRARLAHLEHRHPAGLMNLLTERTLTHHLRTQTAKAIRRYNRLVDEEQVPAETADDIVNREISNPAERSKLYDPQSRRRLRSMLNRYKDALATLPRTYLEDPSTSVQ